MATSYAQNNSSSASKLILGKLIGVAGVGRKPFTIGSGVAEYNLNKYNKVGAGHVNRETDLAKDMKNFLGGQGQTIYGSEGARELLTVAQEYGRKGAAIQLQTIIVNQVADARNSSHFRIMRPRQMTDAELKGYKQEILKFQYTPPTEAPEFAPPHYLSFETEVYEGQGYRFNNGFRFNAEMLLTEQGLELLSQMAEVAINNFVKLMEQIVTYCLMGVEDRYKGKKLLIDSGAISEEELMQKFRNNGQGVMGASFLAYNKVPGIFQRKNGFEFLMNWVKKVTQTQGVNITHLLVVPDSLIGLSFDRTDYTERGPEATRALYEGEDYTKSIIKRINGVEIVEQPTYEMRDARIRTEQALSNIMEIGQHYVLDMTPYHRLKSVQSARGIDSSAPRRGAAVNDLYYLDYSTDEVTKRRQSFAELMHAALCWDEHGELNDILYRDLENPDSLKHIVQDVGVTMTSQKEFKPDPWLVWSSDGRFKRVNIVGNQDTYHTSVEATKFAVNLAYDMITYQTSSDAQKGYSKLVDIMERNYKVSPDQTGDIEGFWTACAWENVDQAKLDKNEAIWYIPEMKLPRLTATYDRTGKQGNIHAYTKRDSEFGHEVVCVKAPIVTTSEGPKFYATPDPAFDKIVAEGPSAAMTLAGFLKVTGQEIYVDLHSLIAYVNEGDDDINNALIRIFNAYNIGYAAGIPEISAVDYNLIAGILQRVEPKFSSEKFAVGSFLYPKPADITNAEFRELNPIKSFQSKAFSSEEKNHADHRLLSVYLQKGYYDEIKAVNGQYASIRTLESNAKSHPSYLWIDKKIVNDERSTGCVDNNGIISSDPSVDNAPANGTGFAVATHPSFWSTKMAMLGYIYPSFFYRFSDLQKCTVFGQKRGTLSLPGVSTLVAMKSIGDQMASSYAESGWQDVDADGLMKTIIQGVREIDGFIDICYRIFSPKKSSYSHRPMESGLCFMHDKFLHHSQATGDADADAKRCFSNMIFPSSARLMGLISPFIHYPLFVNKEAALSGVATIKGNAKEVLYNRKYVEMTIRFTDVREISQKTPFIISSPNDQNRRVDISAETTFVPSSYSYLSGKARDFEKAKNTEFNFVKDSRIQAVVSQYITPSEKFVVQHFLKSTVKHLMKDSNFLYSDFILNRSDSNPDGVDEGPNVDFKLTGGSKSKVTREFFSKIAELLEETIKMYPGFFNSIDEYFKALFYFIIMVRELFNFCFDDQDNIRSARDFKPSQQNKSDSMQHAAQKVSDLNKLYSQRAQTGAASSSSGRLDSGSRAAYDAHVNELKTKFAEQLYQDNGRGAGKLYVATMFLGVDAKYWINLDAQMKKLYGLKFDGLGVQFSLARPQDKYGFHFVDSVINPDETGTIATRGWTTPGARISKYLELTDFGPGSKSPFNLNTLLMKFASGSHFHRSNAVNIEKMVQEHYGANSFFFDRYNEIEDNWAKKAIALAYLTARPTADLMISLHEHGIPQPMVLVPVDPFMTFRMNSALFVDATDQQAFLGHHLTFHTTGMDSDTREMRHHFSAWIFPFWPRPEKVVQVPNVSFSGVISGCSGRIVKSIAGVRSYGKKSLNAVSDESEVDWDPANPGERRADRFVNYAGGSVTSEDIGNNLNIVGNNHCPGSNLNCGVDLPLGLIPVTHNNTLSHPSALIFNLATGYFDLNRDCDPDYLHPASFYHVRANRDPGRKGGVWNVWTCRGKQYIVDYNNGTGDIQRHYGSGPLSDIEENDGYYLRGMPKMFKAAPVSSH